MNLLENLKWRYATKKFDSSKKVNESDLKKLKEAIQLSASSFGLQLYKVLIIESDQIKEKLKPASWEQTQITEASHIFIFCNYTKVIDKNIDDYINLKSKSLNIGTKDLEGYSDFMKNSIGALSEDMQKVWTAKQTYIAMGNLLTACAELKIDACPMEGFDIEKYNDILALDSKDLSAAVITAVGYRSGEDATANAPKIRKSIDDLFEII
ncbi:NAD(P)H-dependent oxidoreductase [Aquimarina agarilytica]|uniref:NAD(P)H-dependent oxidoreductase n=1 Tax=Aquimarina agarilytica TaxID=1087449 RepID=UPI0002893494|nr:NAD(P)H-dependent oxidoreductase [Aquimarina agarilytica]